jgi:NTP pyrophosphatase (non-canonical NTP hydrolase)
MTIYRGKREQIRRLKELRELREVTAKHDLRFDQYQHKAMRYAVYPNLGNNWVYPVLGLCGECGEIANKLKKVLRDGIEVDKDQLTAELGDILWYVAALAYELNLSLDDVASQNLEKLENRRKSSTINGSGDSR